MPKKRTKDKHLPPRVYYKDGGHYFVDMNYKWIFLGNTLSLAMMNYAKIMENTLNSNTMHALLDRYIKEISPTKASTTHRNDIYYLKAIRSYFGKMPPHTLTARDVYKYLDIRSQVSIASANKELSLLTRVLQMGIRWGIITSNVCREVERLPETVTRNRYVEDWEFQAVYKLALVAFPITAVVMMVAYLTGLRLGDLLSIKIADLTDQGILITASKTKKTQIIKWSPELSAAVRIARDLRSKFKGFYLFTRQDGKPYTVSGFQSIWQRLMKLAMDKKRLEKLEAKLQVKFEKKLKSHWMFKDIRAKSATDLAESRGLEFASALLQHSDIKTTQRHYIKKEEVKVVEPVR